MLRTLVISVPTKSRNSSSRGFKCSVQTLSATSMSLSNTGFKTVSHRLRNTFFVVVIPSFMPSNIGCPHSFQKSEMLCQVSHHSVFKAFNTGCATPFHKVSKISFMLSNSTPSVFHTCVPKSAIRGNPTVRKFCSIGNTATFQISENTLLKLSKSPMPILPSVLKAVCISGVKSFIK